VYVCVYVCVCVFTRLCYHMHLYSFVGTVSDG
jgi:hypothetical protein